MCETVWVLASCYEFTRTEITAALSTLLRTKPTVFSSTDRLASALGSYREGKGDLADYVIREHARACGADRVATFDKALLDDPGFFAP